MNNPDKHKLPLQIAAEQIVDSYDEDGLRDILIALKERARELDERSRRYDATELKKQYAIRAAGLRGLARFIQEAEANA